MPKQRHIHQGELRGSLRRSDLPGIEKLPFTQETAFFQTLGYLSMSPTKTLFFREKNYTQKAMIAQFAENLKLIPLICFQSIIIQGKGDNNYLDPFPDLAN